MTQYMLVFSYTSVMYDHVTITCDRCVTVICNIMLTPNPKPKNKKFKYKKIKMRKEIKIIKVHCL